MQAQRCGDDRRPLFQSLQHPKREEIEQAFLTWTSPVWIAKSTASAETPSTVTPTRFHGSTSVAMQICPSKHPEPPHCGRMLRARHNLALVRRCGSVTAASPTRSPLATRAWNSAFRSHWDRFSTLPRYRSNLQQRAWYWPRNRAISPWTMTSASTFRSFSSSSGPVIGMSIGDRGPGRRRASCQHCSCAEPWTSVLV
jgi:hypothetical protein